MNISTTKILHSRAEMPFPSVQWVQYRFVSEEYKYIHASTLVGV